MDLKDTVEVAAGIAGLVTTILEIQHRISDYRRDARADRLRGKAEELSKFLQIQTQLQNVGADEHLTQQAVSAAKTQLDEALQELIRLWQAPRTIKVDELSPVRRWLLLFVPARPAGWILHFGFYFSVCFLGFMISEIRVVLVSPLLPGKFDLVAELFNNTVVVILLRYWALMEKRWAEGFQPDPSRVRQRLLWYGPASRRELMARAALIFGLFQFGTLFVGSWGSRVMQLLTFVLFSITLVAFYAWNNAELSLATHPVELGFVRRLRFFRWPCDRNVWFWTICFYFIAGNAVFFVRQIVTVGIPAEYRKAEFMRISAIIGFTIGFMLSYLLPMYALNRILMIESKQNTPATKDAGDVVEAARSEYSPL